MFVFFFSSRRRHTICALGTGVQTCALPIYFLIAVMVDGVLQWRMVPRPSPWVLKEKVDAAKARATKQTVAVSNVKVSEAPALPVETAVNTAPETVIIPRLTSIPDLDRKSVV